MILMWVIGGLVIGFLVFLMIRRKWNRAEMQVELKDKFILCPKCSTNFYAPIGWARNGLRGRLFICTNCHARIWL